ARSLKLRRVAEAAPASRLARRRASPFFLIVLFLQTGNARDLRLLTRMPRPNSGTAEKIEQLLADGVRRATLFVRDGPIDRPPGDLAGWTRPCDLQPLPKSPYRITDASPRVG